MYKEIAKSIPGDFEYLYDLSKQISLKPFGAGHANNRADELSDLRCELIKALEKIDDLERSIRR